MTLHIMKSNQATDIEDLRKTWSDQDALVIIQNAVLIQDHIKQALPQDANIRILIQHCESRGISPKFTAIDMNELAILSSLHENSITW